jgi:thermitase
VASLCVLAPSAAADGRLIVKYAPGASAAERAAVAQAAGVERRLGSVRATGADVVRVRGSVDAAVRRLNRSSAVLYAEPDVVLRALAQPNDPMFGQLYGIHNTGQSGGTPDADLDGPEGWDLAGLGAFPASGGVEVGIVDTGMQRSHPDLAGKLADCAATTGGLLGLIGGDPNPQESRGCEDDNDHGTHVSGTIAAVANNGIGVAGVAFNSSLSHCKALHGPAGAGSTSGVANCITYLASKGSSVISMSLGGGSSTTLQNAVRSAYDNGNGAVLVAAAGNDGNSTVNYPAGYAEVISVAATDRNDRRASFSNANASVELAAAGVDVVSTVRSSRYRALSGTSMATPHVAGVAALVRWRNPGWNAAQVRSHLAASVDDLGTPGRDTSFGHGRTNLAKAGGGGGGGGGGPPPPPPPPASLQPSGGQVKRRYSAPRQASRGQVVSSPVRSKPAARATRWDCALSAWMSRSTCA